MRAVYVGHDDVLLCDYNGLRYAFRRNIPQDVPAEVYNHMITSGNVEAEYLKVCEEPKAETVTPKAEPKADIKNAAPKVKKNKK